MPPARLDLPQSHFVPPVPLRMQEVGLDRLIGLAVERGRPHLRTRDQHLHVEAMAAPIRVYGDRDALADALAQLLCAASLYAGERGVLTLAVSQIGLNATLTVRARAAAGNASAPESCDWSAVGRVLETHGASISTGRTAEGDLEYRLLLPVTPDVAGAAPRASMIGGPERAVCRVLVVDDSADSADSVACLLAIRGHEVHVAYDGRSAYEKALSWQPDVLLLDIDLPGMNGDEIAQSLRVRSPCPTLIALSGYAADASAPFDLYLAKPVDPSVLLQSVERYAARP